MDTFVLCNHYVTACTEIFVNLWCNWSPSTLLSRWHDH